MLNLKKKLQQKHAGGSPANRDSRVSVRDKLLVKEVDEMGKNTPHTCKVEFDDPDQLHTFRLIIRPDEGYYAGGTFRFHVNVPSEYNNVPPNVTCDTRIWHPNINEQGEVCLSLLRINPLNKHGWTPTRTLKDVIIGLNLLFTELLNFEDPLNVEAADHHDRDKDSFKVKVKEYIQQYAKR